MTNKEKYKQAFSAIHISDEFNLEVNKMKNISKKHKLNQMVAGLAACVVLLGCSVTAYAVDLGGIQRTIQLWIHGDQSNVNIDFSTDGSYEFEYIDKEGNNVQQGGGGVAFNADGSERPLTQDELLENINRPEVVYEDDGKALIYYYDQKIDITDKFENNVCYAMISNGEETLYMTIKYKGDVATSPHKYPSTSEFN